MVCAHIFWYTCSEPIPFPLIVFTKDFKDSYCSHTDYQSALSVETNLLFFTRRGTAEYRNNNEK